jgi:hypothetical protein
MAEAKPSKPSWGKGYKRSWKNYLLDAHYQLRFTLIMVILAGLVLAVLGYWVMRTAGRNTALGLQQIEARLPENASKVAALHGQEHVILLALIGIGVLLLVALFIYGIMMTHKVAGPIFKIGTHLDKMKDGRYAPVYNLRKGDQLVQFFAHFKAAHGALRKMQLDDIAAIRQLVEALYSSEEARANPALAAAVAEAEKICDQKHAGIEDSPSLAPQQRPAPGGAS